MMLPQASEALTPWVKARHEWDTNRLDMAIEAADLLAAVEALVRLHWGYLAAITGMDVGEIEVLYHFCRRGDVLTLRVRLPREAPVLPSLCGLLPSARLYEQELREMFGVTITGLPDGGNLFLPDDWTEGVYPLRKDAKV